MKSKKNIFLFNYSDLKKQYKKWESRLLINNSDKDFLLKKIDIWLKRILEPVSFIELLVL